MVSGRPFCDHGRAMSRRVLSATSSAAIALAALALSGSARATITQPTGVVMPQDSGSEVQLYTMFQQRNDPVNWLADGSTQPAVFSPLCDFQATFVLKQSGSSYAVAWYNALPGLTVAPTGSDLHVVVPAGSPVGAVITGASIKADPAYAGGSIGFALVGGQTHYSEQKWNPKYFNGTPWITAVIYASKVTPNAFYVAFEDGATNAVAFGNDGDFNDYVYFFEGLLCSGGGNDCGTGQPGVCAAGLTRCDGSCGAIVASSSETCNGFDDDCNGVDDDGDLCPVGQVCDKGTCVAACSSGEFQCDSSLVCSNSGYCVDPACETVSCPSGSVCVQGTCRAPCDGVVCPGRQLCRVGRCVDPCDGITCPGTQVCSGGVCRTSCNCAPCGAGKSCEASSGACLETSCVNVPCGAGTLCVGGTCVDACQGAACPAGQICQVGACVTDPNAHPDAGSTGGASGSGGTSLVGGSSGVLGSGGSGASTSTGGSGGAAGAATSAGGSFADPVVKDGSGCACRATPARDGGALLALLAGGLAVVLGRRSRRAR